MRLIYGFFGTISLSLGIVGVILPILPTTPFLLLSMYLYTKTSVRAETWFKNTALYKKILRDFVQHKTMKREKKWILLILVDIVLIITLFSLNSMGLRLLIIGLIIIKHWYFHTQIKAV